MSLFEHRKKMIWLLLIFVIPMLASYFLFFYRDHFKFNTTNKGYFVSPPVTVTAIAHKWQVVYVPDRCEDHHCEKNIFLLGQLQKALGKDYDRIHVTILKSKEAQPLQLSLQQKQKDFNVNEKVFLVDPLGNLFMYYPNMNRPMDILKDIKHLLGISQIG